MTSGPTIPRRDRKSPAHDVVLPTEGWERLDALVARFRSNRSAILRAILTADLEVLAGLVAAGQKKDR